MDKQESYTIREMLPGDRNFIFASWLRGLYYGQSVFSDMSKDTFMANYHEVIEKLLSRPSVYIRVACLKDDPEVILGYVVGRSYPGTSALTLDWVFVKSHWRKIGVARNLVPASAKVATHLTKVGKALMPSDWAFNPFAL